MIIHFNNTEIDLTVNDNSYRYRAIKQTGSLTLYYSLPQHLEIPIGAWCEFEGETYTLTEPENFKKHNNRNFEYTLILSAPKLDKYKFKDTTSRRLKFSLTAKPHEHLQMLVDNLNQRETGWSVGTCIDAVEKLISYNHAFCSDALGQMADTFETEWEIVGKTINLCKVEYNKDNPLPLSYGRGNGFKTGVGRQNGDKKPVEILYVQGGERNIDASKYGSSELLLPKSQTIGYDGEYFSDQAGYNATKARQYVTDADGFSLRRSDKPLTSQNEDSLDLSNIYPSRVGMISTVTIVNTEKHFYDITDQSIPANLNFADCLIQGEDMTVIFQDGMLAGKEFEVKYIHTDRRFEIVQQEMDGRTMPDDVFKPVVGGKYAVFGISLPDTYVCDNETKTGASWDMFREAAKFLYENEEQKFTFTGELDGIWAKKDWLNIGGRIKLGGYVLFSDNQFQPDGVSIRIVGIKDYINNPHSPQVELSNEIVGTSISSDLRKIETNEVIVDELHKDSVQFTKRRFRDSQETMGILEDALLDKFTNSISPITVQTMAMLVGDESLQFRFVNNTTNPTEVAHNVTFNTKAKILTSPAGIIQHLTLGIDTLSSSHALSEYKFWSLPIFNTPPLIDGAKKYYLYAKVSKTATTGVFYISETAIALEGVFGYYHLLMGVLNSEYEGERSYVSLYGFTEILPGRITTDKVVSADGQNFIDFLNNAARIGNANTALEFNINGDGKLRLKGTLVQSQSGVVQPLECFRGEYNPTYTYYQGDTVTYQGATYRFIYATPQSGRLPTNTTYWIILAQKGTDGQNGTNGQDGAYFEYRYAKNGSTTTPPTISTTSANPSGWTTSMPSVGTLEYLWMTVAKKNAAGTLLQNWSTPVRVNGVQGEPGNSSKLVKIESTGQIFKYDNSEFTGIPSPQTITLNAVCQNIEIDTIQWQYYNNNQWNNISTGSTLIFSYDTINLQTSTIRVLVNGIYTDQITISKLADGDDSYSVILTNESHTIACDSTGAPKSGELGAFGKARCDVAVYCGAILLRKGTDYLLDITADGASIGSYHGVGATDIFIESIAADSAMIRVVVSLLNDDRTTIQEITRYMSVTKSIDGEKGDKGDKGESPALVFRGDYSSTTIYYGTNIRVDCVKYNGTYYVARIDAGNGFTNQVPTNTAKWNTFGAQFDSVATQLLLAENANIAGWIFRNGRLESNSGNTFLDGNTGQASFAGGKILLKEDSSGQLANGNITWDINGNVTIIGKLQNSSANSKIIIDPSTNSLCVYNSSGEILLKLSTNGLFLNNGSNNSYGNSISLEAGSNRKAYMNPTWMYLNDNERGNRFEVDCRYGGIGTNSDKLRVMMKNLPTSTQNLVSGELYRDGNTVKIVP